MKKETPSKVVIIPKPPVAANEDTSSQDPVIATKSMCPPMPPAPAAEEEAPKIPQADAEKPAKRKVCKTKLPPKPVPQK